MAEKKKFNVTINKADGTLDNEIFKKMAVNSDITSISVLKCVGKEVTVTGRAEVTVETSEKTFSQVYFNTNEYGIIHCGAGTMFDKSYSEYADLTDKFIVTKIECKLGKAYKAVPKIEENIDNTEDDEEDTPFK